MEGKLNDLFKQAQKIQSQIAKIQEELAQKTTEVSVGGGMVTVVMNGRHQVISLKIDPEVVNPNDVEMLQDLIIAAVNEAFKNTQTMLSEEMSKITGGIKIPGLF